MTDSPRALALHILRGMVADSRLRAHVQSIFSENDQSTGCSFVVEAMRRAILPGFAASEWIVSNAALQLHSTFSVSPPRHRCRADRVFLFGFPWTWLYVGPSRT